MRKGSQNGKQVFFAALTGVLSTLCGRHHVIKKQVNGVDSGESTPHAEDFFRFRQQAPNVFPHVWQGQNTVLSLQSEVIFILMLKSFFACFAQGLD